METTAATRRSPQQNVKLTSAPTAALPFDSSTRQCIFAYTQLVINAWRMCRGSAMELRSQQALPRRWVGILIGILLGPMLAAEIEAEYG